MVEATKSQKNDSLSEERQGATQDGAKHFESSGRQASRKSGFHEGQVWKQILVSSTAGLRHLFVASAVQIKLHFHSYLNLFLQNSDGIFPNAAIAKKLGEVMGDSSEDISKAPSKK